MASPSAHNPPTRSYRLVSRAVDSARRTPPVLDEWQQQVVDHAGGPLLVLAGPGTGKTTTMVEAIAALIEHRGVSPEAILALTFSRKAAEQLRDRVTARVGRTMSTTMSSTFHSFAYGLIKRFAPEDLYDAPLRLLSAPEQDIILRELLRTNPESVQWPTSLRLALGTRGFAHEVAMVLSRAREKGLDGPDLVRLGRAEGMPAWEAAGLFLDQYLTILDAQGATDYPDLIRRAVIEAEEHRLALRAQYTHVFVDEYQDTDPSQVALLQSLAGDGGNLVAVGDPHQSIYAFRGAEVRGILDFPRQFPTSGGADAPVIALPQTRRFGSNILLATQRLASRLTLAGSIPVAAREAFAAPRSLTQDRGRVEVKTFDTERAEAEHLADLLRRAHLEDGIAWSDMAVLVRSGRASIGGLRRSLTLAGVPVEVAGDEVPLGADPAVLPLVDALQLALRLNDREQRLAITDDAVSTVLAGPLGGMDAAGLRRLARELRARDRVRAADRSGRPPRPSRALLASVLGEPGFLNDWDGLQPSVEVAAARQVVDLLEQVGQLLAVGGSAHEALWQLWSGSAWQARLRRAVAGSPAAARRAHRDLDALCALFEAAARAEVRTDRQTVETFLAGLQAQQIPADSLAERGLRGDAVRLLTAHRSKGLEWPLVVVAQVQAEGWPDLRRRSTLLGADRLGAEGAIPPVSARALLMEERRLFYVACTRAKRRLVVTAVASQDEDGDQPSRFLDELGVTINRITGRPSRPMSLDGVVAALRRTVASAEASPALRAAAARRLAALARERNPHGRQLVPGADPGTWWGTRGRSVSPVPLADPHRPVPISASMIDAITTCPTQWFLAQRAGGVAPTHQAANVGSLVHALAEQVTVGALPPDLDVLMGYVDQLWPRLEFRTPWARQREHERTRRALARFLSWDAKNQREVLATETSFRQAVDLPSGEQVLLQGRADRVEVGEDGELVVVDLKTGRKAPSGPAVLTHAQLSLYQLALQRGALDALVEQRDRPSASGVKAELVQLGLPEDSEQAKVQQQPTHTDQDPARLKLFSSMEGAVSMVRSEEFRATPSTQTCRGCLFTSICPTTTSGAVIS